MAPTIEELYNCYDTIVSDSNPESEKIKAYTTILEGFEGNDTEKRLSSQFVAKFFNQFKEHQDTAFNKMLDLCDEESVDIRKHAIHDLHLLSNRMPLYRPKISSILVQLLQTEDTTEYNIVSMALSQILQSNPKATLTGIFNQMLTENPDVPRDHTIKFLKEKLRTIPDDKMDSTLEDFIIEQLNKVLKDVAEDEFIHLISVLSSLKSMSTVIGRQKLVNMITQQAVEAVPEFIPQDPACVAQIRESGKHIALYVSKNVQASEMLVYLLSKVMPKMLEVQSVDQLCLLQVIADLSGHGGHAFKQNLEQNPSYLAHSFKMLCDCLPVVPENYESVKTDMDTSNAEQALNPELKFSELECLLYICHNLGAHLPHYFEIESEQDSTTDEKKLADKESGGERLKVVKPNLQYLGKLTHDYAQSLTAQLQKGKPEDNKINAIAHKVMNNIQVLLRGFFKKPVSFLYPISIGLSWHPESFNLAGAKRSESQAAVITAPAPTNGNNAGYKNYNNYKRNRNNNYNNRNQYGNWKRNFY